MRETIQNYFEKTNQYPKYYSNEDFSNICDDIKKEIDKGVFLIKRKDETDLSVFEEKYGYTLPTEISDYINLFWHPCIRGYCNTKESIVLFSVLKKEGDSSDEILFYENSLISMAKDWEEIGDIKKFIPIGWLGYSGGYVLYEVSSHNIFLENMDVDGEVEDKPIANSLKELINKEYIRYIASLANERGAKFDRSYFYQLICDAGEGQRFFTSIRFDEIDIDALSGAERAEVYEKASDEAVAIVAGAVPTDETNDMTGAYWQEDDAMETGVVDSVVNGETTVSYEIPENYSLQNEGLSGKTYYSDSDKLTVVTSIVPYSWMTASDMADRKTRAGISKVTEEGQCEVNGVTFYYYTYSTLYIKDGKRNITYYFNAYADLKDGNIYTVSGFADDNPDAMDRGTYYSFMNITEK